jgi:hypothetical protein
VHPADGIPRYRGKYAAFNREQEHRVRFARHTHALKKNDASNGAKLYLRTGQPIRSTLPFLLLARNRLSNNIGGVRNLVRPALAIMITGFGLPSEEGSGMPNHSRGLLLPAKAISGLSRVRTELGHLRVIPSVAPHPEQANG